MQFMASACRGPATTTTPTEGHATNKDTGQMRQTTSRRCNLPQLKHYQRHVTLYRYTIYIKMCMYLYRYLCIYLYSLCVLSVVSLSLSLSLALQRTLHFIVGLRWLNINVIYYSN